MAKDDTPLPVHCSDEALKRHKTFLKAIYLWCGAYKSTITKIIQYVCVFMCIYVDLWLCVAVCVCVIKCQLNLSKAAVRRAETRWDRQGSRLATWLCCHGYTDCSYNVAWHRWWHVAHVGCGNDDGAADKHRKRQTTNDERQMTKLQSENNEH